MRTVLIDDMATARESLRNDLKTYAPDIQIIGEAKGVVEGAKLIRQEKPDVVFLDIQMKDGSGFDLLEILGETPFHLVFTTAHDGFAIKAFRFSAIDYLLKPIDPDELKEALAKIRQTTPTPAENVQALLNNVQEKKHTRLALHTMEKIHVVHVKDILRCESSANYTIFHFTDKRQLLVTKTLKEFDKLLSGQGFMRVHQSHLVNSEYIKEFVKTDGGYLIMSDSDSVPVSSRKRSEVMQMLSEL